MNREGAKDVEMFASEVIGAAIEAHRFLGPGLLESAYEACLAPEIKLRSILFERQISLPVEYKGEKLDCGYRLDMIAGGLLIIELKAVKALEPVHLAQLLTYLRLKRLSLGLLLNFHASRMQHGIKRVVNYV